MHMIVPVLVRVDHHYHPWCYVSKLSINVIALVFGKGNLSKFIPDIVKQRPLPYQVNE